MSFDTRSTMALHIFNLSGARLCVACARTPAIFPVGDSRTFFQVENCTWIHAAMVYNGQELQLYLDGEEQVTNVTLSGMSTNSTPEAIVNFCNKAKTPQNNHTRVYLICKLIDHRLRIGKSPRKLIHTKRKSGRDGFGCIPTVIYNYHNNNNI